jgi:hypothetical protein
MKRLILLIIIFALTSCDLFTTRTPENPTTSATTTIPATTPAILFSNFKSSIEDKVLDNYMACFVDSAFLKSKYRFIASSGSGSSYSVLNSWSLEAEKQYFRNMKAIASEGSSITLNLSNQINTQFGDSAVYQFDYTLSLLSADKNITGDYQGTSQFKIFLDSRNQWVIVQWEDSRKKNEPSWSDLKGRLGN